MFLRLCMIPINYKIIFIGGIHGISFTTSPYRHTRLFLAATTEVILQAGTGKDPVAILSESRSPRNNDEPFAEFGTSHAIVLHTPLATLTGSNSMHSNL